MALGIEHWVAELSSGKQASRKKAIEAVTQLLEDLSRRAALCDRDWSLLVKGAVGCAKQELAVASKGRKAPRREAGDFVERVVKWADGSGVGRRLAHNGRVLVEHVVEVLAGGEAPVIEGFGGSYCRLLVHVLGQPEYAGAVPVHELSGVC